MLFFFLIRIVLCVPHFRCSRLFRSFLLCTNYASHQHGSHSRAKIKKRIWLDWGTETHVLLVYWLENEFNNVAHRECDQSMLGDSANYHWTLRAFQIGQNWKNHWRKNMGNHWLVSSCSRCMRNQKCVIGRWQEGHSKFILSNQQEMNKISELLWNWNVTLMLCSTAPARSVQKSAGRSVLEDAWCAAIPSNSEIFESD